MKTLLGNLGCSILQDDRAHPPPGPLGSGGNRDEPVQCESDHLADSKVAAILARRIDIGLQHIPHRAELLTPSPHLCGWKLIDRSLSEAQILQQLPDLTAQVDLPPPDIQDLIHRVVSTSMEHWRDARARPSMALIAAKLRRDFFNKLYEATVTGEP